MDFFQRLEKNLTALCPELELRRDEPMDRHTTFRVGGPVALMAVPRTEEQAIIAVRAASALGIEPFFLGNGSNLLVPDEGAKRFLIKTTEGLNELQFTTTQDGGIITAGGGVPLARLSKFALDHCLTGLEFAQGIPGSLGGAVTMNGGAYGGEMSQAVSLVTCLTSSGVVEEIKDCDFGYRRSAFSDGRRLILRVQLTLKRGEAQAIRARMEELAARRKEKQPLDWPSAGSTFKRPEGHFAAALIDQCGLKGLTVGGAQVSEKHAGFVINRGGATCGDVLALVEEIKARVLAQTGVKLELEVKILR